MATDRSLTTLLRALQRPSDEQDASRLLGSATTLLTLLSNPLNLTLLSSQILTAPAIWRNQSEGLTIPLRVLSVINTASLQLVRNETDTHQGSFAHSPSRDGLDRVEWVRAVARGADDKSAKWKHLLILGGLLVGFEGHDRHGLPRDLRHTLEASVVDAANAALTTDMTDDDRGLGLPELAAGSIVLVLGHVLALLSDAQKARLRHDLLLPILTEQLFFSKTAGLNSGYFLGIADRDILQLRGNQQFTWSANSTSFYLLQKLAKGPLVSAFGSMSSLLALCMERVADARSLLRAADRLAEFTRSLAVQWRQNKLSELDRSEEPTFLDHETRGTTLPLLWQVLRSTMFSLVLAERALLARVLSDAAIPRDRHAYIAVQALHVLRGVFFISSRFGGASSGGGMSSFSQLTFLYMAAIDVLAQYPSQAEAFLSEIRPKPPSQPSPSSSSSNPQQAAAISAHPHDRSNDLFFFNTAEHLALVLSPAAAETLLLGSAMPYLHSGADARLMALFEAAHSVVLAVLSCPANHSLVARTLPGYVATLLAAFPGQLSPRQFRLAARTLVRVASPPGRAAHADPLLASAVLELLHHRFLGADERALPPPPTNAPDEPILSEKAALLLTMVDCLPVLALDALDEWLPVVAESLAHVQDGAMRDRCRARLWDVLSNGEMDVVRAERCVEWWNTSGGRDQVLGYAAVKGTGEPGTSGAMPAQQSKL